jgi:hypothetical protein
MWTVVGSNPPRAIRSFKMALFAGSDILFFGFIMFVCVIGMLLYAAFEGCIYLFSSKEGKKRITLEALEATKKGHENSINYHQRCIEDLEFEIKKVLEN